MKVEMELTIGLTDQNTRISYSRTNVTKALKDAQIQGAFLSPGEGLYRGEDEEAVRVHIDFDLTSEELIRVNSFTNIIFDRLNQEEIHMLFETFDDGQPILRHTLNLNRNDRRNISTGDLLPTATQRSIGAQRQSGQNDEATVRLLQERVAKESKWCTHSNISRLIDLYYSGQRNIDSTPLKRYRFKIEGMQKSTTMFTNSGYIALGKSPKDIDMKYVEEGREVRAVSDVFAQYSSTVHERLKATGVVLQNKHVYRLVSVGTGVESIQFSGTNFFDYRFSSGLLEDEVRDSLIQSEGRQEHFVSQASSLPVRQFLLPDTQAFLSLQDRICCGGLGVLFAIKKDDGYIFPLHERSSKVSDGRGQLALLPKAFHQAEVDRFAEANIYSTVFREVYEEMFGGKEAESNVKYFSHDWYFDKHEALKWFRDNPEGYLIEVSCLGFNAINGNYDFGLLLIVEDPAFERTFRPRMRRNFEVKGMSIQWIFSKDLGRIRDLILTGNWASESLFQFVESLLRLKKLQPNRVDIPDIERQLM